MSELLDNWLAIAVAGGVVLALVVGTVVARARSRKAAWKSALDSADLGRPALGGGVAAGLMKKEQAGRDAEAAAAERSRSMLARLSSGLARTKERMVGRVDDLFRGRKEIDDDLWRDLEELLVKSDVGIRTTTRLLESMRATASREEATDPARLREILRERVRDILAARAGTIEFPAEPGVPLVIMVVGVNGAGKTTTIGKLAARYTAGGKKVVIGAGDTFRAAAIEQVVVWARRAGAEIVKHGEGADPAAVAHDAVQAAVSRGADVVICDTAGRLQTKTDLMAELTKVHRVIGKVLPNAPHEVLLVVDSTNGQNAISQARQFTTAVGVTGIVLTKLDGTARGGVIIGIADEMDTPVKLIGIGEAVEDLRDFDPEAFVDALFGESDGTLGRGRNSAAAAAEDAERGIEVEEEALPSS